MLVDSSSNAVSTSFRVPEALSRSDCLNISTSCYCEENVWRILKLASSRGYQPQTLFAVFISNPQRRIPVWFQVSGEKTLDGLCVWDYHVVALVNPQPQSEPLIYDVDSNLPFPVSLTTYVRYALWHCGTDYSGLQTAQSSHDQGHQFRSVPYEQMIQRFASDRRHMVIPGTTSYFSDPPPVPCIRGAKAECEHTLPVFLQMDTEEECDPFCASAAHLGKPPGTLYNSAQALLDAFATKETSEQSQECPLLAVQNASS